MFCRNCGAKLSDGTVVSTALLNDEKDYGQTQVTGWNLK